MSRLRLTLLVALCALLAVPALADAHGRHQFRGPFPHAASLCARADANRLPARLAASSTQVKAACTTLENALTDARNDYRTAVTPLATQARTAVQTAVTTCRQARAANDRAACRTAIRQARTTLRGLRTQARTAVRAYFTSVQQARRAFWTTIRALRGGTSVPADGTTPVTAPSTGIPSDASLTHS